MTTPPFSIRRLGNEDRSDFGCGEPSLDAYIRAGVGQDVRRQIATAFIAVDAAAGTLAGYYTLSATQVLFTDLDEDWRKRLPRYPSLPAVLVGRLAVDERFKGRGLGGVLLFDAARRTMASDIAARFMVVDALNEDAARFYEHHGFRRVPDDARRLFVPLATLSG